MPSSSLAANHKEKSAAPLIRLVIICWLAAKFISLKVWIKDRLFPVVPVADWLSWPSEVHYILFAASVALMLFLLMAPTGKKLFILLFITEIFSCAADQTRWQPWEYQYLFTILICIINYNNDKKTIGCIAFVMAATYFYSGIGKLNEAYLVMVWDNTFLKQIFKVKESLIQQNFLHYSGYLTAIAEIAGAAGLFFTRTRKAAAWILIAMHLLILYALGPLGTNYNAVVWPWNILMAILLYIIFIKQDILPLNITALWQGWNKMVLLFWGIFPALNYAGCWDSYLSSRLYSGELPQMAICIKDSNEIEELQPYLSRGDVYHLCDGRAKVNLQAWAMKEMNVPPYPEIRVYNKIRRQWAQNHPASSTSFVIYKTAGQNKVQRLP